MSEGPAASGNFALALAVSPGGTEIAMSDGFDDIWVWDRATGAGRLLVDSEEEMPMLSVRTLVYSADGTQLMYYHTRESKVVFADAATGEEISSVAINSTGTPYIAPDGSRIAWVNREELAVYIWTSDQPDAPRRITLDPGDKSVPPTPTRPAAVLTADGSQLVFGGFWAQGSSENEIWVIDLAE
jgi:hypothetical protein